MRCIAMQINLVEFLSWKTPCKNYFVTINIGNLEMSFKMTLNFFQYKSYAHSSQRVLAIPSRSIGCSKCHDTVRVSFRLFPKVEALLCIIK